MDLAPTEQWLRNAANVIVVDPRVLRRVIKHHRSITGLVPHGRTYVIDRASLLDIVDTDELGVAAADVPDPTLLVARPTPRDMRERSDTEVLTRLWRAVFHARVHVALMNRAEAGALSEAAVRARIEAIGKTEFDEIRAILRHDDLVLPPVDDRAVYEEFAAVYLELRHFAPALLVTTFPGLSDYDQVDGTLAQDVDVAPLLEEGRPQGVGKVAPLPKMGAPSPDGPISLRTVRPATKQLSAPQHQRLLHKAEAAQIKGNDVRAALQAARAAGAVDVALRERSREMLHASLARLEDRLQAALASSTGELDAPELSEPLRLLAERSAAERGWLRYGVEARVLYTLQRAVVAFETRHRAIDVATWMASLGKRPVIRTLEATRELRLARYIQAAAAKAHHVRMPATDRKRLTDALQWASARAEVNVRGALRPRIEGVLDKVGFVAQSTPERLARDKLIEELLDQIIARGFLSFPQLRDAVSRNQLKLDDLSGGTELWRGDPLLAADAALDLELDGIYQRGDIYLRALQKASSVPFGTRVGRVITLYLLLPCGGAFVLLEGAGHIINFFAGVLDFPSIQALTWTSFLVTAGVLLALIHSEPLRLFALQVLEIVGIVLAWVFFRIPRAILTHPVVRTFFARPAVRLVLRRILTPALVASVPFFGASYWVDNLYLALASALGTFALTSGLMGTPIGGLFEDYVVEQLVPTWQVLSRQWIPGLLRLISRMFAALMDLLQRAIYRVDEVLRFHQGEQKLALIPKAALGLVWAVVAYALRLYVTLLVEPELNPLKHFPVCTVSHKLLLPFTPQMLAAVQVPLSPLGPIIGGAIGGVTVFLLPSVFGFLTWEFKENYKLYRATRPDRLSSASVGPHGETMRGLLVAGLHSGTLPKIYERLRRAAQLDEDTSSQRAGQKGRRAQEAEGGLARFREGVVEIERGVRRFVERDLLAYLHHSPRWKFGTICITNVELSSNRIRVQLTCESLGEAPCELTFEQQAGHIVAGMPEPGFVNVLQGRSPQASVLLENALAGFYARAEVDLVREQIEGELGEGCHYSVGEEGLTVWPGRDYRTELLYRIDAKRPKTLAPQVKGEATRQPPRVLDTRRILYRHQTVSWLAWVSAWVAAESEDTELPRLLTGTSLLPSAPIPGPSPESGEGSGRIGSTEGSGRIGSLPATPAAVGTPLSAQWDGKAGGADDSSEARGEPKR